jgi:hypothetical protein
MKICRRGSDDIDVIEVPFLCRRLIECLGAVDYDFENVTHPVHLRVERGSGSTSESIFDSLQDFLNYYCNDLSNLIVINYKGHFIKTENEYFESHAEVSEHSADNGGLSFFIKNRSIHTIVAGVCVDFVPNASVYKPACSLRGDELNIDEWKKLLAKFEEEIKGQKLFFYWAAPKSRGLLVDSPEKIFRKHLANYLQTNTANCIVDEEAYNDRGTDRTDVRVITALQQDVYYFELKCLGKCESGTKYEENHAHEGLVQTSVYVDNDRKSILGVLVVFDGRSEINPIIWPNEIVSKLSSKVAFPPAVMLLEKDSASTKAKAGVKRIKS